MLPASMSTRGISQSWAPRSPLDAGNAIYRKTFNFGTQNVVTVDIKGDLTEGDANSIASQLTADLNPPL
jgi:hypothetical protein